MPGKTDKQKLDVLGTDIVQMVRENQVSIVLGETGSGKSTQLVQYLLDAGLGDEGTIVCAQPRKVAAVSLAKHVAKEMAASLGEKVGYRVGGRSNRSKATKILFTTDHTLLNECLVDPSLSAYSCIVVDEAHERSLYTDLLLAMIKRCLPQRPDLKVIVTSATIDPQVFQDFFSTCCVGCPVMKVSGRTFPVEVWYEQLEIEENMSGNYVEEAVKKVIEIHVNGHPGDILVFLTSPAETEKCCKSLQERLGDARGDYRCFQLHGQHQADEQQKVFEPLDRNKRKIVFATNCAETSITIDGIRYVVDTGVAKEMRYDHKRNLNSLSVTIISKSSAEQRKGRAGRTAPGACYRLYSQSTFEAMDPITLPEILRTHLGHALLKLAELGVQRDMYDFVQSPSKEAIDEALNSLERLGAIADGKITPEGKWIAQLPVDPQLGMLTLKGKRENILYDAIALAAVMSAGSVFYRGTTEEDQAKLNKTKVEKFCHAGGDCLTALSVYKEWQGVPEKNRNQWCAGNSLNAKTLRLARDTVNDVCAVLQKEENIRVVQKFSTDKSTDEKLRKLIFSCYYVSLCHFLGVQSAGYFAARASRRVHIHPSSVLRDLAHNPQWVVYSQLVRTSRDFITGITPVEESWITECDEQKLGFDLQEISSQTVSRVHTVEAGTHVFFSIVGPQYTRLRQLEEDLSMGSHDVILEANRGTGTVSVWTTGIPDHAQCMTLKEKLDDIVRSALEELEKDDLEIPLAGDKKYGVRVVLGQGAEVMEILTPSRSRTVYITRTSTEATEDQILRKFRQYGQIKFSKQFSEGRNWGILVYKTSQQARTAADRTRHQPNGRAQVEYRRPPVEETVVARVTRGDKALHRTSVCIDIAPRLFDRCLDLGTFIVHGRELTLEPCDVRANCLTVRNIPPNTTQDQLRRSLLDALYVEEGARQDAENAIIPHACLGVTGYDLERAILSKVQTRGMELPFGLVRLNTTDGHDEAALSADVTFRDAEQGIRACEQLGEGFSVNGHYMRLVPRVSVKAQIQSTAWQFCRDDVLAFSVQEDRDVEVTVAEPPEDADPSAPTYVTVTAPTREKVRRAMSDMDQLTRGDIVDCSSVPNIAFLMTPAGRRTFLQKVERKTAASVSFDTRLCIASIHGTQQTREKIRQKILEYVSQDRTMEEEALRGDNKPPGVMKNIIERYGVDMEGFCEATGLESVSVDFRRHQLRMVGNPDSMDSARQLIREVKVAIKERTFPICCCHEGCDKPLAWRDFRNMMRRGEKVSGCGDGQDFSSEVGAELSSGNCSAGLLSIRKPDIDATASIVSGFFR
nr:hypothetical protein BaRGS_004622 [Batillaria attramentaria]